LFQFAFQAFIVTGVTVNSTFILIGVSPKRKVTVIVI